LIGQTAELQVPGRADAPAEFEQTGLGRGGAFPRYGFL